jgi:methionine-gamma-lyase
MADFDPQSLAPETLMMRYGYNPWWSEGAVKPPLFLTSTFLFKSAEDGEEFFKVALGKKKGEGAQGLIYSRLNTPSLEILEERLALWEKAEKASVFASGMAAISTTLLALCQPGDAVAYTVPIYGGTAHFMKEMLAKFRIEAIPISAGADAAEELRRVAPKSLRMVFVETPSNPTLIMTSIREIRKAADELASKSGREILLAVDNTMLGPVFQHPIQHGADLSIYSATKFIGGHSDLIAGAVLGRVALISEINGYRSFLGTMGSPFVCWQMMRSLETLKVRMEKQAENAMAVARFLASHSQVQKVYFPGQAVEGSRDAAIVREQLTGPGSMISFEVKGGKTKAFSVLNSVKVCHLAVSLGGTETLIEHPKTMTHSEIDEELMQRCGITDGLIRLSVGLESPVDLIADLKQALEKS